ncbi:MAG TPA: UDP-3-O-acyl-N-acetylglucosamine deacetylase [Planctomycetota bacterium]
MVRKQRTLKSAQVLEGRGLHSGAPVKVRLEPAPPGTGVVFQRTDLDDPPDVPALPQNLSAAPLRTVLRVGPAEVSMVEHLLAACHGLGVDNLFVKLDGPEMPGLDGSAAEYVAALRKGTPVEQKAERKLLVVDAPILLREGGAELIALPPSGPGLRIRYIPEFPEGIDATPFLFELESDRASEAFATELAPARTFVLAADVEKLKAAGYGKGADLDNTLVLGDGPVTMRIAQEPTRHKVLDLVGDLGLLGADLQADVLATCSGHALNQQLVKNLRLELEAGETAGEVREGGYDIQDVMRLLPHRYPFLLVDRVIEVEGFRRAVGVKNVSINEPYFQGHWPEKPVMPGVLQLEAMAQLSGFLLQRKLEHAGRLVVLASIDKVRFRGQVVPGDQLRLEVETLRLNRSRGQVQALAKVGRRVVAEAILSFAMVDA